MNFTLFLRILYARRKIILITLAVVVVVTTVVSFLLPKTYKATASLVLNYKGADPVTGMPLPAQLTPGYMATQVDIINSRSVALKVIDDLKMAEGPAVLQQFSEATQGRGSIRDWLADLILRKIEVVPSRESSVLDINYKAADPQFAAAVANAFASAYQLTSIQLKVEPAKRAAIYINDQIKVLRDNFEAAQKKLSKFQQDNGIVSSDSRIDGIDVESARLNELSGQLVAAQAQLIEATSRRSQASGAGAGESPDVMSNSLIQNLKASLGNAESKFAEVSQRLEKNHPQYLGAKAEVDKLRSELNEQIKAASNSVGNSARIYQQREAEIRAALEKQKIKVLEINRTRDDLKLLRNEVESAQRAYESTTQRFTQTNLEGQSNQTDITILTAAVAPLTPSNPKIQLNILVSIFLGTMLGVGLGLLAELLDRRIRAPEDLVEVLKLPVLGEINWNPPKRARFRLFGRNSALQRNLKAI
ncbi:succinoglycan biosynthesis transport protein ExoP [Actimicrobium sp. GrIS 1.19]|uniref:chain length determinant protein EpsF n=1 Tax=Actimicrobium sp. GrIS 1.19 TaxID=3071708 RepID=UPI002E001ECD|nr:succinoglycan biosynthesis transport protein ExoP [Actimicrobium sp. GrIS 1.19]